MCLDLCRSEYAKAVTGCEWGMSMIPSVRDLCIGNFKLPNTSSEQPGELRDKRLVCFQNCKQGCLKLQYKCEIKETEDSWDLPKEGEYFKYLCDQFPGLSEAKLKERMFVGPDIRKMLKDENFETKMETNEIKAW
ncbi:hypothetical protein AVEN_101832-1 [Araneus ventricosus]|uniref:Uncharacterized protein n=1 Tax=Araneus ventricosus TaxID=182803 RepID=A0A4Y2LCG4_ARAVE|nr:hypothetical protein AVEN_101832-1 [Araneus ventricosus]